MTNEVTEERLRNTRAWAAARVGSLSGADVIVAAIDELLRYREIVGYELAEPADEPTARVCPDSEDGNHALKQDGPFSVVYCDACGMNRGYRTQEPSENRGAE